MQKHPNARELDIGVLGSKMLLTVTYGTEQDEFFTVRLSPETAMHLAGALIQHAQQIDPNIKLT